MRKVIVIGAGGHARSVMDIMLRNGEFEIVGCLDPCYISQKYVSGMEDIPIIGDDDMLAQIKEKEDVQEAFVAIGGNALRKKLTQKVRDMGMSVCSVISKEAIISPRAHIGEGTCVMPGAVINVNCRIGEGCIINTNCSLDHDCVVGDYAHVAPGVAVSGTSVLGEGVHVGTNTAVIDGVQIGAWSYIGAGAAVVKDIPEHVMAYGVPAKVIKTI